MASLYACQRNIRCANEVTMSRRRKSTAATGPSYRHPVPDARVITQVLESAGVPMTLEALTAALDVKGPKAARALQERLRKMAASGRLLVNRSGEYCLLEKIGAVTGIVSAHRDGFGFLLPEDGTADVYLPFQEMRSLLHGDRVAVRVDGHGRGGRRSGTVVEILERGKHSVVGTYQRDHGIGYVVETGRSPHHFLVPDHQRAGAQPGQLVKLEITEYPGARKEAQGKIVRLLGNLDDPGMATEVAIELFELPVAWNSGARKLAGSLGDRVSPADKKGRTDLRDTPLVTIDGEDARDFDDAVFAEPVEDGWRLLVAIADVSHYVNPGDALDTEAVRRGTSVYFPDRVVPMLPESLSNGLCSLKPDVDRLCVVCEMHVTGQGKVSRSKFYKAVMRSKARLTYTQVNNAHEGHGRPGKKIGQLRPQLDALYAVYRALERARHKRGALDLELPETRISLDDKGRIETIAPLLRNDAHRLIEECMIAANVEAAKYLKHHRLPTLYRVHPAPEQERFEELRLLLQALGIKVAAQTQSNPRQLNKVLRELRGRPDFQIMAVAVLRSMSRALYQPKNEGHFGLALSHYAHFTSPIRRYPDLLVHRGLSHLIEGGKPGAFRYDMAAMESLGLSCSSHERRADDATRHVEARYKCIYIQNHVGDVLPGVVTGVTPFGLFVTISDLYVEGLVHVTSLRNDYYHTEHGGLRLTGERTGASFGLGDVVRVRVMRVNVDEARIDLTIEMPEDSNTESRGRQRRSRRGARRRAGR